MSRARFFHWLWQLRMPIPSLMPKWPAPASAPHASPRARGSWRLWAARGVALGLVVALLAEVLRVLFAGNIHTVVPGRVYRSAQLNGDDLRQLIEKGGIRTVVNLRGCCMFLDWYQDECRIDHDANVAQEDVTLSANRLPAPSELRRLIEVFDRTEYPIVLHCRQGSDRTGLASAIWMLLYTDADYAVARRQCGARFAHLPVLSTVNMDRFFDAYEKWLKSTSQSHTPELFRHWALHDYRAGPAPVQLELLEPVPEVAVGEPLTLHLRARNLSHEAWEFKTGAGLGIHARYYLISPKNEVGPVHRAGLFEARVAPGETIELSLPFPPFQEPGTYRVNVDFADRQVNFSQLGSEFLMFEVHVRAR
jgi:protein tyrosine phosphatase (PTP) superfamily phosphohydrolase (DUF442 family)